MAVVVTTLSVSSDPSPGDVLAANYFGDTIAPGVAGPLGLFIILVLLVVTVLLVRNMNSRIRRLPASFDDQSTERSKESDKPGVKPDEED